MVKYNNMAYRMGIGVLIVNTIFPIAVIHFATQKPSPDSFVPMIGLILVIIVTNIIYFNFLYYWYFTSYDEQKVVQKWFKKRKKIYFNEVKYIYLTHDSVIISEKQLDLIVKKRSRKERKRIKRIIKNEVFIYINDTDKVFPKILLSKCVNAEKVDLGMEMEAYRKLFELD